MLSFMFTIVLVVTFWSFETAFGIPVFEYQVRNERLLEYELTYATFQVDFGQNLDLYEAATCTKFCRPLPIDCTPCDYSVKETCGTSRPLSSNQTSCSCPNVYDWCEAEDDGNVWVTLQDGVEIGPFVLDSSHPVQNFRFHFDKPCAGFRVWGVEIYGNVVMNLGYDNPSFTSGGYYFSVFPDFTACPIEFYFGYGTFGVNVLGLQGQASKFMMNLEFIDLSDRPDIEPQQPELFPEDPFAAYQVQPNIPLGPMFVPSGDLLIYRYDITECVQFLMHREISSSSQNSMGDMGILLNTGIPALSPSQYHINSPLDVVFTLCPDPDQTITKLYFSMANIVIDMGIIFTLSNDSSLWKATKFSEWGIVRAERYLRGAFDIQCGSHLFTCLRGAEFWGSSCIETWSVLPTTETTGLWPRPRFFMQRDPTTFTHLPFESNEIIVDHKIAADLLLEVTIGTDRINTLESWKADLALCTLNFRPWAHWSLSDNTTLVGKFYAQEATPTCTSTRFNQISLLIDQLSSLISETNDSVVIFATRYQVDLQTFTPSWQDCNSFVQSFLQNVTIEVVETNTICSADMLEQGAADMSDPCCNHELAWSECCRPRTVVYHKQSFQVATSAKTQDNCGDPECFNSLLSDYVFYEQLRDSGSGCSTAISESLGVKQSKATEFYRQCKEQIFGPDGYGKPCQTDADCVFTCDLFNNLCVYQNQSQLDQAARVFMDCVAQNMRSDVRDYFYSKYSLDYPQSEDGLAQFSQFLYSNFQTQDCVGDLGRSTDSSGHGNWPLASSFCPGCRYWCFDETCVPPLRCEEPKQYGRPGSACSFEKSYPSPSRTSCEESEVVCTYNNTIETEEECLGTTDVIQYSCVVCETPTHCVETSATSEAECLSTPICVVGGQVIEGLKPKSCLERRYCSVPCDNCQDQQSCEATGYCSDQEAIEYLQRAYIIDLHSGQNPDFVVPADGYCIQDINAWNDPDCSEAQYLLTNSTPIPTALGCLVLKDQDQCNDASLGAQWMLLAQNQHDCEGETTCRETYITTSMTTSKPPSECVACGGTVETVYTWRPAFWLPGVPRTAQWRPKQWTSEQRWDWTIDFNRLGSDIMNSVIDVFSLELQTEAQCRLNPVKDVVSHLVCLCSGISDKEKCFEDASQVKIGIGKPCSGQNTSLSAPPAILNFDQQSISDGCIEVSVSTLLSSEIKSKPPVTLSLSFRKPSQGKPVVVNTHGAEVGRLVGDGVMLVLSATSINNFTLCLSYDPNVQLSPSQTYDFAEMISNHQVTPLGLHLLEQPNSNQLCSLINPPQSFTLSYFPIIREQKWQTETTSDSLSSSDKAIYAVMFTLYAIVFIIKCCEELFYQGLSDFPPKRWICLLLFCSIIIRTAYLAVLLSNSLSNSSNSLIEFLLIEVPSYFYFLSLALAALLWYSVVNQQRSATLKETVLRRFGLIVAVFLLFVFAIILAWLLSGDGGSYSCQGRIYQSGSDQQQQEVRTAYRVLISFISLAICCVVMYFGRRMTKVLKQGMNFKSKNALQLQTYIVSLVAGVSLIGQCIFFGVYSTATSSAGYLFLFLPLELFPASLIFLVLATKVPSRTSSSVSPGATNSMKTATRSGIDQNSVGVDAI